MLSTSRVYSIPSLLSIPLEVHENAFRPLFRDSQTDMPLNPEAFGPDGLTEFFSTQSPVSIYGATKLASEVLSVEYGETFGFPVFINRCGVMAGAGQFGRADQGIFAFWVNSHLRRRPMNYIGFEGLGYQVRDCLHPRDLASLIMKQMRHDANIPAADRIMNCSGGIRSAMSLRQLTDWCDQRFGSHPVRPEPGNRPFDIPWLVLDPSKAMKYWDWQPDVELENILEEIAAHALENPDWLRISALH
jgi:CDP-paratose 2-epimerase